MSTNCLVTKLKGEVNNTSLPKLGEICFNIISNGTTTSFTIANNSNEKFIARCVGTTFTDGTTEKEAPANADTTFTVNRIAGAKVFVGNKYNIPSLTMYSGGGFAIDTADMKYCSKLRYGKALRLSGNIEDVVPLVQNSLLTELSIWSAGIYSVSGDISVLASVASKITDDLNIMSENVYGDATSVLENLGGVNNTHNIDLSNTKVSLDCSLITHDRIPCVSGYSIKNEWKGTRSGDRKIIAFDSCNFTTYVDAMLINQADCQVGYTGLTGDKFRTIKVYGTRTSESDAAVATLKSKGYTVIVNDITL